MKPFLLAFLVVVLHGTASAQIIYVDKTATGANNGSSWTNAFTTLTDAVQEANNLPAINEIRMAKNSTYTGNEYFIRRSYNISGGWDKATNSQPGGITNATILDGELTHRIMNIVTGVTVHLSGLHFTRGGNISSNGGGLHTAGIVTVNECFFTENKVIALPVPITYPTPGISYQTNDEIGNGGALCNRGTLIVSNSYFQNNWAARTAGAIANRGTITITGCTIQSNYGYLNGGAVFNYQLATMKVDKCRFSANNVDERVGFQSYFNGGGGAIDNQGTNCVVLNSIFDKNTALGGGAINNWTTMTIRNCSFYANATHDKDVPALGGAILGNFTGAATHVLNCLFLDNYSKNGSTSSLHINGGSLRNCAFPAGTQSVVGPTDQRDNINNPPLWVDAANGDFRLQAASGVINKGNNEFSLTTDEPGDFYGQLRISPCTIDIGAAEYQLVNANGLKPDNNGILYVDQTSTYNTFGDKGSAWNKSIPSLADALLYANTCESVREIHVAKGTYQEDLLVIERGYMLLGSYDPATNSRDWKNHPTIIDLKSNNTTGRLLNTTPTVNNRSVFVDGFVFQDAAKSALVNSTDLTVANCAFNNNKALTAGGAVYNSLSIRLINCVFADNTSNVAGGALLNKGTCILVNSTLYNNTAAAQTGKAIYNESGSMKIHNSIVYTPFATYAILNGGSLELNRNIIMGVAGNTPNYVNDIDTDQANQLPLFTNEFTGDFTLKAGSPAINVGSNALYEAGDGNTGNNSVVTNFDMAYKTRVYDGTIDLGAYERPMKQQTISISDISVTYGDAPIDPATTNSGLPVDYATYNVNIAQEFTDTDNKEKIRIKNKGTVLMLARQLGNAVYDPATSTSFTITVNPKPVTVTAETKSKVYGDADPALTYSVAPSLVVGDAFTGSLGRDAGENAGTYAILQNDLSLGTNYLITYAGADLNIDKKAIAITAESKNKTYGEADPALTYTFSPTLAFSDAFSGSLNRQPGENVGAYAIQNGLTLNNNYILTYTGADLTITRKGITVTALNKNKTYGQPDPELNYTLAPALVGTDALAGNLTRTAGEDAGTYAITQGSLANNNYTISFVPGQLTIDKATQQITWNQLLTSACDGSATLTLTGTSSSGLPVNYQSANTAIATIANNQLSILTPGITAITASQPGNNNYLPAANVVINLTSRLPAHLLVKHWNDVLLFDNSSKTFNGWQWYKNGSPVNGATGQYYYESGNLNGEYYAVVKTTGNETLPTCPIIVTPGATLAPMSVFPNPVGQGQTVTVKLNYTAAQLQGATVTLSNNMGAIVATQQNVSPQTNMTMPLIQGLYIVRVRLSSGLTHSVNVLVKP
ncbi:T9SS C-terminal target domain-containing protein [Paraflavitalea soli]|uniref:T9SS C-terminal target domain-containing protein n=1 Tax=Paraflavitalea soli TaxID=2315862 RepID=A0A3B7MR92_9BACT|nr:MBG domain-containing protein [Paraflavitalea soli]AXY73091.1 T9SS C-terminal target domain-containing protein [Paraflavitalea soli]